MDKQLGWLSSWALVGLGLGLEKEKKQLTSGIPCYCLKGNKNINVPC